MSRGRNTVTIEDADFCSECGSILPLPGASNILKCMQCDFQIDVRVWDGRELKGRIVFDKHEDGEDSDSASDRERDDQNAPTAQRKCSKCGNETMTYTTKQTRSADEGQTVFYTCTKCRHQETDFS